jgi:hypothetical protein
VLLRKDGEEMNRHKNTDWLVLYKRRRWAMRCALSTYNCPAKIIENNARLILEAHHAGPYRMLWALFKYELNRTSEYYLWKLGLKRDESVADRIEAEEDELAILARSL